MEISRKRLFVSDCLIMNVLLNHLTRHLDSNKYFLPGHLEGDEDPEHGAPGGLHEQYKVSAHVRHPPMEGEHAVTDTVSHIHGDRVHARLQEGRSAPPLQHVDQ